MDCDAFYAAIEKRDDPSLTDLPVIVGGGTRGVVSTCCYIARRYGVRSAMPMFQARKLCPNAVVIKPRMSLYVETAREIRKLMRDLTPLVEPLSLDEAYLDLSGTTRIHGMAPAKTMARLALAIEERLGITVSIGLSGNKFLAKLASELDKPRGFAVIGMAEAKSFLRDKPVGIIRGAGKVLAAAAGARRLFHHRQAAGCRSARSRQPLWRDRPVAGADRPSRGQPAGRSGRRDEDHLVRDHFQQRSLVAWPTWKRSCGGRRNGFRREPRIMAWRDAPWC